MVFVVLKYILLLQKLTSKYFQEVVRLRKHKLAGFSNGFEVHETTQTCPSLTLFGFFQDKECFGCFVFFVT